MPSLLEFQRDFRSALLHDMAAPAAVRGGMASADARLGIYRNNVTGNLTGALRLTFPAIERLVGAEFFAASAIDFVRATPPAGADLYEYGAAFPKFLAGFAPAHGLAYLPDVARLEWAVNRALHAPVMPPLSADAITAVPTERHAELRFMPHPSLSLLWLSHPVRAIWQAVLTPDPEDRAACLAAVDPNAGEECLAVVLAPHGLEVLNLTSAGFRLADALWHGRALGDALDGIGQDDAASLFSLFLNNGCWQACALPGAGSQHPGVLHA